MTAFINPLDLATVSGAEGKSKRLKKFGVEKMERKRRVQRRVWQSIFLLLSSSKGIVTKTFLEQNLGEQARKISRTIYICVSFILAQAKRASTCWTLIGQNTNDYKDMFDHRSYVHNLSTCEIKF